jgi:chromosome segregation ATPase
MGHTQRLTSPRCACSFYLLDATSHIQQAMKELQRGERTAAALEGHLDSLEKKIEELLAQAEKADQELKAEPTGASDKPAEDEGKSAS